MKKFDKCHLVLSLFFILLSEKRKDGISDKISAKPNLREQQFLEDVQGCD